MKVRQPHVETYVLIWEVPSPFPPPPASHSPLLPVKQPFDGIWASFWYDQVHRTTGFDSTEDGPTISETRGLRPFPPELLPLLRLCSPFYEALRAYAIKPHDRAGWVGA